MLKSIPVIFWFSLFMVVTASAQDSLDMRGTEISLNANRFVEQFLSFSDSDFNFSEPYLLSLHVPVGTENKYFRVGVGARFQQSKIINEDSSGNEVERNSRFSDFNLRLGVESRKDIHSKFRLHYGFDVIMSYEGNKTESLEGNEFESSLNAYRGGIGPVLGISFLINDKISLWTESSLYITYTQQKQESSFSGIFIDTQSVNLVSAVMTDPISLHFRVSF